MAKEKGATPSRRLPGRSGRATFEGDPTDEGARNGDVAPAQAAAGSTETGKTQEHPPSSSQDRNNASGAVDRAGPPAKEDHAPVAAAPRGRGRPRKKPLEQPPPVRAEEAGVEVAATAAAAAAASPRTDGSSPASSPRASSSPPRAVGGWETARAVVATNKEEARGSGGGGNESDEWSDNDEVHDLPDETKAQFGQVVWAKFGGSPPWPALVWDPRFLEKNKAGRDVARQAYAALGKSHLVRFYDKRPSYSCAPYKSIKPFDIAELPTHLKGCSTAKKKENFKECAQMAVEAARLSRSERLAEIHEVGRWTGKKKTPKTPKKTSKEKEEQQGSGKASQSALKASAEPPKKRGRGRPRKTPLPVQPPVKELDEDPPSPVSSAGAEYELPVPEASEDKEGRAGVGGEDGGGEEEGGGGAEEELDDEDEQEDEDDGGGDDDDEEEFTMDGEPEEDEDDKLSDEDFVAAKGSGGSSRKSKGRGRPRKSGGDGSGEGGGGGGGGGRGRKKKAKRPRPTSPSPSDGAGSDVSSGGERAAGGGGGISNAKKARHGGDGGGGGMAPGQAKARALAVVRNFVASLPPMEFGRDEGWIASKEEAREAASSKAGGGGGSGGGGGGPGSKRERASGGGAEKGEKRSKKIKSSSREEREREEKDRKERLSQMKSSPEPIWKQHRRFKEEKEREKEKGGGGTSGLSESSASKSPSGAPAAGGNRDSQSQIQTGRKLTHRLGKASAEGKFNKDEVLEVLQKLGELNPSRELLQQSGCGKAVASARKYFFGGQVKHNDKDVAAAASSLRGRWMDALAGTGAGGGGNKSGSAPATPRASSSSASSAPPPAIDGNGSGVSSSFSAVKKPPSLERTSSTKKPATGQESPRARSPKVETGGGGAIGGTGSGREPKRENGGKASPRGSAGTEGGRYGGGGDGGRGEEKAAAEVAAVKQQVKKEAPRAVAAPVAIKMPAAVAMDEPRRRAMGMLMSVLGTTAQAVERCTAIEEELHQSQGREINKEYLRRLRTAVFSMEGSECQRLRVKVMSEMVLPRDFVTKSCEELRALAGLV